MFEVKGKNGIAKVFTNLADEATIGQVFGMLEDPITKNAQVRIMPDCHAGKGSTVGTTIRLPENFEDWKVSPNVVGVDVACGMFSYKIAEKDIDLVKLDEVVNSKIPAGFSTHSEPQNLKLTQEIIESLSNVVKPRFDSHLINKAHLSLGTLGGGNHFIELSVDENGEYWLTIHSGSRNLGLQVAQAHQKRATELHTEGNKDLAYLTGADLEEYLSDCNAARQFAVNSRKTMLDIIVENMGWTVVQSFDSIHNFIDYELIEGKPANGVIRKGATSARKGELLLIPLNMRDGSLICVGKGNADWNESAPHGAGRIMSRSQAKQEIALEDYEKTMEGVYSSSVGKTTLDEAPQAYKPFESIIENIGDTVEILHHLKPVYNFKAH